MRCREGRTSFSESADWPQDPGVDGPNTLCKAGMRPSPTTELLLLCASAGLIHSFISSYPALPTLLRIFNRARKHFFPCSYAAPTQLLRNPLSQNGYGLPVCRSIDRSIYRAVYQSIDRSIKSIKSNQIKSKQITANQSKADQITSTQIKANQIKSGGGNAEAKQIKL